ncbi:MAG: hypothetical protein Q4F05_11340 [bacterium]|nr:hypothetical protein [bacterium]
MSMNRAERRRQEKAAAKKKTYNVSVDVLERQLEKAMNDGRREGLDWLNVVMLTLLEDHFEFGPDKIAKLKEFVNFRISCLEDYEKTNLSHNDLRKQTEEMAKSRAEHIRSLNAEEMAAEISFIISKFIRLDKRELLLEYLVEPYGEKSNFY